MTKHLCAKCGRSMVDPETGQHFVGLRIAAERKDAAAWARVYPEVSLPFAVELCFVCFVNLCGVDVHA